MAPSGCPKKGCPEPVRRGQLMCRDHWYRVPIALRREVNETWRAVNRTHDDLAAHKDAFARYRLARQAAIDAVNAQD